MMNPARRQFVVPGYDHSGARSIKKLQLCRIYIELELINNIRCLRSICHDSQHAVVRGSRVVEHSRPRLVGYIRHLDRWSEVMRRSALSIPFRGIQLWYSAIL
jgi:hypothetical protein